MVNASVHAHMGPGATSGTGSVVDEQGVECLSLESVVQPHMLQAGLGRLSLAEANATGDLSDGVSIEKTTSAEPNQLVSNRLVFISKQPY
ncbi:hypothetical protein AG1IA_07187 [Rhizoctonia solani AG-1 IA]|uniref:Uncharacterized protein n=1 Tax=Thanatephorus cucumeris (strain AG1-IA) TaxID=983506 RepID=L8WKV5_THACA|nr:hypothetical protein AG1IA_07187 [Rhizoctonia solani AG-1 IA]